MENMLTNREIKFRVWDRSEQSMTDWEGIKRHVERTGAAFTQLYFGNDQEMILMQYTGLKDKNGKEIYEGDIIQDKLTSMMSVVKFGLCKRLAFNGWYVENEKLGYMSAMNGDYDYDVNKYIEVIGNIFENPELLK